MRDPSRTRIKICGITTVETAQAAVEAGADAIGLMVVEASPRYVDADRTEIVVRHLPPLVEPVRVFRDAAPEDVTAWRGRLVQLHGDEGELYIADLKRWRRDALIIRGFRFSQEAVERWARCPDVDALLIDGSSGGEGQAFDHAPLAAMMDGIEKPVILAGGLDPENVGEAIQTVRPYAVDVSSGVESTRGVKDPDLIRAFCAAVRAADAAS